jgi:hypothetical protein
LVDNLTGGKIVPPGDAGVYEHWSFCGVDPVCRWTTGR